MLCLFKGGGVIGYDLCLKAAVRYEYKKKIEKYQKQAESAAKQSKRNSIPVISDVLSYKEALKKAESLDVLLVPYENERGMLATKEALAKIQKGMTVGIIIGPEGGFSDKEIALAKEQNGEMFLKSRYDFGVLTTDETKTQFSKWVESGTTIGSKIRLKVVLKDGVIYPKAIKVIEDGEQKDLFSDM